MWNRMEYMVIFSYVEGISNVALLFSLTLPGSQKCHLIYIRHCSIHGAPKNVLTCIIAKI